MRPNNNTLDLVLSEKFESLVWKVMIHENGTLAVETRNTDLKQVAFSVMDVKTGQVYFRERTYQEAWQLNLAFAGMKNLLINGYGHSDTPESKGIMSVDARTGDILWQKFNISLNQGRDEGIEVFDTRLQPRRYFWIDHLSGDPISAPGMNLPARNSIIFPETRDTFPLPPFIDAGKITGHICTLSYLDKEFLSFHEVRDNYLQQRLIVYQEDRILLDDIITTGIQKLQPEAFFMQLNHLVYIRNKREIVTYLV